MIVMPDADMDQAVDALIGAGYGSAGERCMAISVAVPVGKTTADRLIEKLIPRVESLKIGPSTDPAADFGPLVTKEALRPRQELCRDRRQGRRQARRRRPRLQDAGLRERLLHGRLPVRQRQPDMRIYKEEIFGPVLSVVRANDYEEAPGAADRP